MQQYSFAEIARGISHERLDGFRRDGCSEAAALARYRWNIALTEALYPALNILEISLRNAMNRAITDHFRNENWLAEEQIIKTESQRRALATAREHLIERKTPAQPGRMVAELTLGFWTSLLDKRHEQQLWPALLATVFPAAPRSLRTRKEVASRLNHIRELRNRAFHHEPIWYRETLEQDHSRIVETAVWISPPAAELIPLLDRFGDVFAARPK